MAENSVVLRKFNILKGMNEIVKAFNHEGAYYNVWCYTIPDQADDDELMDICENMDEIFEEACEVFGKIMRINEFTEAGLYIGEKVYKLRDAD